MMDVGMMAYYGLRKDKDVANTKNTKTPSSNGTLILIVGEVKCKPVEDAQNLALANLAAYAREVFRP